VAPRPSACGPPECSFAHLEHGSDGALHAVSCADIVRQAFPRAMCNVQHRMKRCRKLSGRSVCRDRARSWMQTSRWMQASMRVGQQGCDGYGLVPITTIYLKRARSGARGGQSVIGLLSAHMRLRTRSTGHRNWQAPGQPYTALQTSKRNNFMTSRYSAQNSHPLDRAEERCDGSQSSGVVGRETLRTRQRSSVLWKGQASDWRRSTMSLERLGEGGGGG